LIAKKATAAEIQVKAVEEGMELMLIDGLKKVKEGITTISEILKVTIE
jgi:type IV pilus assembly protein PilB